MKVRGAYMTVKDFLQTYQKGIVYTETESTHEYSWNLEPGRSIVIPDYQREYRWEEKQLTELLDDISKGDCYLGQIAVARNSSTPLEYHLVDGQQRITSIIILHTVLCRQFFLEKDSINIKKFELHLAENNKGHESISRLNFKANCFKDFQSFISQIYNLVASEASEFDLNSVFSLQEDLYRQKDRYINACSVFNRIIGEQLKLRSSIPLKLTYVKDIIDKILSTRISVVIFDGDSSYESEKVFLDINEKGLRLDNEDILKAYYFQSISSEKGNEALKTWTQIKKNYFELHTTLRSNKMPLETFVNYALQTELLVKNSDCALGKFDDDLRYKNDEGKKHICQLFTDTDLHESMQRIACMLENFNDLLVRDENSQIYINNFKGRDSSTRKVFKILFNSVCRSDMKIVYLALIKLWWLRNSNMQFLDIADAIQLFSFYIISNVSGLKKEKPIFNNGFISAHDVATAYTYLHVVEIQMLQEAYTKATTLKRDQEKAEFLSFNIQLFYNDFKFNIKKAQWDISISNQEFLYKYDSNRYKFGKDHFLIQNGKTIILYNGEEFTITKSMSMLRKRAYNFIYHEDTYSNVDFITRLVKIEKKDNSVNNNNMQYGNYEKEYFSFIKNQVQNFFMKDGVLPSWEEAIKRYKEELPNVFPKLISSILEEHSSSWNNSVCKYFNEQFSLELKAMAVNE